MNRRPPSPEVLQRQCDAFNARYAIGQTVSLRKDGGEGIITKTRSEAQVLSGHSAVIWLEDVSGCYLLERVTPITGGESLTRRMIAAEASEAAERGEPYNERDGG
jgi:hypothetical protein